MALNHQKQKSSIEVRKSRLKSNLEICREFNWTLEDVYKLTHFEKIHIIKNINQRRKKIETEMKKRERQSKRKHKR